MIVSSPNAAIFGIPACGLTGQLPDVAQARGWSCGGRGVLAIRARPRGKFPPTGDSKNRYIAVGSVVPGSRSPPGRTVPLIVGAFEGNKAETKTMLPVIEKFMAVHHLPDVTVVADAGMISEANQKAIEAAGLSFILDMKVPDVPYLADKWRREHPGEEIADGYVFT
jgi:hypothetical protein